MMWLSIILLGLAGLTWVIIVYKRMGKQIPGIYWISMGILIIMFILHVINIITSK
jgi:hypothetical protein